METEAMTPSAHALTEAARVLPCDCALGTPDIGRYEHWSRCPSLFVPAVAALLDQALSARTEACAKLIESTDELSKREIASRIRALAASAEGRGEA